MITAKSQSNHASRVMDCCPEIAPSACDLQVKALLLRMYRCIYPTGTIDHMRAVVCIAYIAYIADSKHPWTQCKFINREAHKKWNVSSRRSRIGKFRKRLASITEVKGGHVQQRQTTYLTLHCRGHRNNACRSRHVNPFHTTTTTTITTHLSVASV